MAYTPINWQTGDTITAEKMNKMDNGWGVSSTQLFSETVTTAKDPEYPDDPAWGTSTYSTQITAESITVTFNGTDYICTRIIAHEGGGFTDYAYGEFNNHEPDFTNYPFLIYTSSGGNDLCTQTEGTYTIAVSADALEVSDTFSDAVNMAVVIPDVSALPLRCIDGQTAYVDMQTAFNDGRILYFYASGTCFYITRVAINNIDFFPESQHVSATFVNHIFTVTLT